MMPPIPPIQMPHVGQGPPQNAPVFNVGPLMNDVQMLAMVAANCPGDAKGAVDRAMDIVIHARKVIVNGELARRMEAMDKSNELHKPELGEAGA